MHGLRFVLITPGGKICLLPESNHFFPNQDRTQEGLVWPLAAVALAAFASRKLQRFVVLTTSSFLFPVQHTQLVKY